MITVEAELGDRDLGTVDREVQSELAEINFPPGYRWELAGNFRTQQESFASLLTCCCRPRRWSFCCWASSSAASGCRC